MVNLSEAPKIVIAVFAFALAVMIYKSGIAKRIPGAVKDAHRALVDWCIKEYPQGIFVYGMICFCLVTIVSLAFWCWK